MTNNINQEHFDNISSKYQTAAESWQEIYQQIEARITPIVRDKVVLDIGNGGRFAYNTNLPTQVIAMDIASTMLEHIQEPHIIKIISDARDMQGIENESVDVIIFLLVLHHINGDNVKESIKTLDNVILSSQHKLRPGGHLIITEGLLSPFLFKIQCIFFPFVRFIIEKLGVSPIFFFSLPLMQKVISSNFKLERSDIEISNLKLTGIVDPLGGSFPGLIKIPASAHPLKFRLLIATKPEFIIQNGVKY